MVFFGGLVGFFKLIVFFNSKIPVDYYWDSTDQYKNYHKIFINANYDYQTPENWHRQEVKL